MLRADHAIGTASGRIHAVTVRERRTIGYRLFGLGGVPRQRREALEAEGIRVRSEGIAVAITYRNYRAPGRFYAWRRSYGSGSVVVTERRLFVSYYRWPIFDLELDDPRIRRIEMQASAPDRLRLTFDAAEIDPNRSGRVSIQLRAPEAPAILSICGIRERR